MLITVRTTPKIIANLSDIGMLLSKLCNVHVAGTMIGLNVLVPGLEIFDKAKELVLGEQCV